MICILFFLFRGDIIFKKLFLCLIILICFSSLFASVNATENNSQFQNSNLCDEFSINGEHNLETNLNNNLNNDVNGFHSVSDFNNDISYSSSRFINKNTYYSNNPDDVSNENYSNNPDDVSNENYSNKIFYYPTENIVANFTSDVISGVGFTTVQFNDMSSGNPEHWFWDFGDGYTSNEQNPTHDYLNIGAYNVSLLVSNSISNNTIIKNNFINVYSPSPNFIVNPGFETGDYMGWDVDEKSYAEVMDYEDIVCPNGGVYSLGLYSGSISQNIDFTCVDSINFWLKTDSIFKYSIGDVLFTFNKSSFDEEWEYYSINTSSFIGMHCFKIILGDNTCYFDNFSVNISSNLADFTSEIINNASDFLKINFTDCSRGLITGWFWDFGDGTNSTLANPVHVYNKSGHFDLKLTVFGPSFNNTKIINNFVINDLPINLNKNISYSSIQAAIDYASNDDIIEVGGDSFLHEFIENIFINKSISLISRGNVSLVPLDKTKPTMDISGSNVLVNGFLIRNSEVGVNLASGNNITLMNCSITHNTIGLNIVSADVNIFNDLIYSNNIGVNILGGNSRINFNSIYNNSLYGLKFVGENINASNNWWNNNGTNNEPIFINGLNAPLRADIYQAENNINKIYDSWIVLNVSSSSNFLKVNESAEITVDLSFNSNGENISDKWLHEFFIIFNNTLGNFTLGNFTTSNLKGKTNFIANHFNGVVCFEMFNNTFSVPLEVDNIAPVVSVIDTHIFNDNLTIVINCDDSNATIFYTVDGSDPRNSSSRRIYDGSFLISEKSCIHATAMDLAGNYALVVFGNYLKINKDEVAIVSIWSEYMNSFAHTGVSEYLGPNLNLTKWVATSVSISGSAVVGADGTIYFGASDGKLYAVNSQGNVIWTWETRSQIISTPTIGLDGNIYLANWMNSTLYSISPKGDLLWKASLKGSFDDNITYYNTGSSVVMGLDRTVYAVSSTNNESLLFAFTSKGDLLWFYALGDSVLGSTPSIGVDGTIYIVDINMRLHVLNIDGTLKWSKTIAAHSSSPISGDNVTHVYESHYNTMTIGLDGTLYCAAFNKYYKAYESGITLNNAGCFIYAYNSDGDVKWKSLPVESTTQVPMDMARATIALSNGVLYILAERHLWAINSVDGSILWNCSINGSIKSLSSPIVDKEGTIYLVANTTVFSISSDGKIKWSYHFTGKYGSPYAFSSPSLGADGTLYVGTTQGLYAFHDLAADFSEEHVVGTELGMKFTDASTPSAIKWTWNFGDGSFSNDKNPIHMYGKKGFYIVILEVTLPDGNVLLRNKTIEVNSFDIEPPSDVRVSLKEGEYGTSQTLTLSASDNSGNVTIYYTVDGSDPRTSETRRIYKEPILIETSLLIKYAAVDPSENWGNTGSSFYQIKDVVYIPAGLSNTAIQMYLDKSSGNSKLVFNGTEYVDIHLVLNKALNLITTDNTKLVGNGNDAVILLNPKAAGSIINGFNITNSKDGIFINGTKNIKVLNTRVSSSDGTAILINESDNILVKDFYVFDSLNAIVINKSKNVLINGSSIINSANAIVFNESTSSIIDGLLMVNNTNYGIYILNSSYISVRNSNMTLNGITGLNPAVLIADSNYTVIFNNYICHNYRPIKVNGTDNYAIIDSNDIIDNIGDGILLEGTLFNFNITCNFISRNLNGININCKDWYKNNLTIVNNVIVYGDGHSFYCKKHNFFELEDYNPELDKTAGGRVWRNGIGFYYGEGYEVINENYIEDHNIISANTHRDIEVRYGYHVDNWNGYNLLTAVCVEPDDGSGIYLNLTRVGDSTYRLQLYDLVRKVYLTTIHDFDVTFSNGGSSQTVKYHNGQALATFDLCSLNSITAHVYSVSKTIRWDSPGSNFTIKPTDPGYKPGPVIVPIVPITPVFPVTPTNPTNPGNGTGDGEGNGTGNGTGGNGTGNSTGGNGTEGNSTGGNNTDGNNTNPIIPVNPTNPTNPTGPTNPVNPTNPSKPVSPVSPTKPVDPVETIVSHIATDAFEGNGDSSDVLDNVLTNSSSNLKSSSSSSLSVGLSSANPPSSSSASSSSSSSSSSESGSSGGSSGNKDKQVHEIKKPKKVELNDMNNYIYMALVVIALLLLLVYGYKRQNKW